MRRPRRFTLSLLVVLLAFAAPASAQVMGVPGQLGKTPGTMGTAPSDTQTSGPLRAPMTLTPTIGFLEEYNDNIFFNNANKQWDLVTSIVPGVVFDWENPNYHLIAAYDFVARLYARVPDRNTAFDRQDFSLDAFYRVNPQFSVSLLDGFRFTTGINVIAPEGVVTGFDKSWSNTIKPGASLKLDQFTELRGSASWTTTRFESKGQRDSDVYRGDATIERELSRQLRGTLGYEFAEFNVKTFPRVTTHTPRVGVIYQLSRTLSVSVNGGPTFEHTDGGSDRITPAATARITQNFEFGSVGVGYDRRVNTSGALGKVSDSQTISADVTVLRLAKGLSVSATPYYRTLHSPDNTVDVRSWGVPLQTIWQFTPWFGVTAGYIFFQQRSDSTIVNPVNGQLLGTDVDQNRVFVGFIFGYPIKFD